jgi:type I restriction enzyme R subunit
MPQHPEHRADAADQLHDRVQADHRARHRLYDGKDYFTIYDFVKAHHHFNDPEWDGEPIEPDPTPAPLPPRPDLLPDRVREKPAEYAKRQKIKVKLADGKARMIQHMMVTSFWHPDGTPMSAAAIYGTALWQAA